MAERGRRVAWRNRESDVWTQKFVALRYMVYLQVVCFCHCMAIALLRGGFEYRWICVEAIVTLACIFYAGTICVIWGATRSSSKNNVLLLLGCLFEIPWFTLGALAVIEWDWPLFLGKEAEDVSEDDRAYNQKLVFCCLFGVYAAFVSILGLVISYALGKEFVDNADSFKINFKRWVTEKFGFMKPRKEGEPNNAN